MENRYFDHRETLLSDLPQIRDSEESHAQFLLNCILDSAAQIQKDFDRAGELKNFWLNNPPENRGFAPRGDKVPWIEVAETTVTPNVVKAVSEEAPNVEFPGLPSGADTRFLMDRSLIHFDVKATGPTDNAYEIVASPNQVSGDGSIWTEEGVDNEPFDVYGPRGGHTPFKPELSPLYEIEGSWYICETFFLKAIYDVEERGEQPLKYLELSCVPNGLLLFEDPFYADQMDNLLRPGKDEQGTAHPRTRIELDPLAQIAPWRSVKIVPTESGWETIPRTEQQTPLFS